MPDARWSPGPASTGETGSGLGLAVVRQIVTASGGRAALVPSPSGGITATASFASM
ncbi:MAG: hypothetical protein ACKO1X_01285 [Acidimicrobiales bacterium]